MDHPNTHIEKKLDRDAEESFQANTENVASRLSYYSSRGEIQPYLKSQAITRTRIRKKQKSSVIIDSPC